ncbi:MAG: endonuclease/exonuclease/phosphatase family protein [Candidatus Krumholzibacteria bacterium]|nr:endonuclease/exonuclease/phosphatase family protein [Candidatus Krumholzibacteria bacterium]
MKRFTAYLFILSLAAISCGSINNYLDPEGPRLEGHYAGDAPQESTPDTIKVISYNVKFGEKVNTAIDELRTVPYLSHADIILLQEMDGEGVRLVADSLDLEYVYYPASVHKTHGRDFGNAVLSRWPIEGFRKVLLPHSKPTDDQKRIAVGATVVAGELRIRVFSVHTETFWMNYDKRLEQADSLIRAVSKDYSHLVIAGDFNTPFGRNVKDIEKSFTASGFVRANSGVGWTARVLPFGLWKMELDHIFTKGFDVIAAGKFEGGEASDHVPLWTILRPLPPDQP